MKQKSVVSIIGLVVGAALVSVLLLISGGTASEYHNGTTLVCYDCHTMHYSMQHGWDGGTVAGSPTPGGNSGNWLGTGGPNEKLIKGNGVNALCLGCHNGNSVAPDVLHDHGNGYNREAGALNDGTDGTYKAYMGHTLDSTSTPPGYNNTVLGEWWPAGSTLECTSCHSAHGGTQYRGLGPYGKPNLSFVKPTYAIQTSAPLSASFDVWINLASYTGGSGSVTGSQYYDQSKINFGRNDALPALPNGQGTSNRISNLCAACHGTFHGGGTASDANHTFDGTDFIRHPTAKTSVTKASNGNYFNVASTSHVKTASVNFDPTIDGSPAPICLTCHKAHGNKNPFSLIFLDRKAGAGTATEEGSTTDPKAGLPNLCHQCHSMGGG